MMRPDSSDKQREVAPLSCLVLARYHLRVLTGHQILSSVGSECIVMSGTKISGGWKEADWFLVRKSRARTRQTP